MANLDKPAGFRVAQMPGSFPVYTAKTKSNLSLSPGDALVMLSNGTLDIADASSASIFGVCQSKLTAVASVQQDCLYIPALPTILFSGQCSGTFTPVNVGEAVDIEGTSGAMEINENAQALGVARIIGLEGGLKNDNGANARVLFTWNKSQWTG